MCAEMANNVAAAEQKPEEPPPDPATAPVVPGRECTIEINKDKMGLGLSIVGGCDTLLVSIELRLGFRFCVETNARCGCLSGCNYHTRSVFGRCGGQRRPFETGRSNIGSELGRFSQYRAQQSVDGFAANSVKSELAMEKRFSLSRARGGVARKENFLRAT